MAVGLLEPVGLMGKAKGQPIRLDMDVLESARIVAAYRAQHMSDLLSEILRPILHRMEQEEIAKRQKSAPPRKPKGDHQ